MSTQGFSNRAGVLIHRSRSSALLGAGLALLLPASMAVADTVTFRQGVNGYAGTADTYIDVAAPTTDNSAALLLTTDGPPDATDERQILIRFDNIFGTCAGRIPPGSTITSATLTVNVSNAYLLVDYVRFHRMMQTWNATGTWNTYGDPPWNTTDGIQADDFDAVQDADVAVNNIPIGLQSITVTTSLQAWADTPASNFGWVLRAGTADSLAFDSSEVTTAGNRPLLTVVFTPPLCTSDLGCDDCIACTNDTCDTGTGVCSNADACPSGQTCDHATGICGITTEFQDGLGSYAETQDTYLSEAASGLTVHGPDEDWRFDLDDPAGTGYDNVGLIRFDNIFGSGPGQIPVGSTINQATLRIYVYNGTADAAGTVIECLVDWSQASTNWATFGGDAGVQSDEIGVLVAAAPTAIAPADIAVTSSLATWVLNPASNYGWIFRAAGNDGVYVRSSEYAAAWTERPKLTVNYTPPVTGCTSDPECNDSNACTQDLCIDNVCQHPAVNCDDGLFCTYDTCDPATGCQHTTVSCDDGVACTVDTCDDVNDECVNAPNDAACNDNIACTTDDCDPVAGCTHTDNCTDGKVCNHTTGLCESPPPPPPLPINLGATWKYFKGTAEPSTPVQLPPLWALEGFDDSGPSWLEGPSGIGYGETGTGNDCEAQRGTPLDDMNGAYASIYMRRKFYVADPAAIDSLQLTMYFDDAFVAYLNGQEVARSSVSGSPNIAGTPPLCGTLANPGSECASASPSTYTIDKSNLVTGVNVLAIQGHNGTTLTSSDFIIAPQLVATAPPNPLPNPPANPDPADGAIGVATSPQLCVGASDGNGEDLTVTFYGREVTSTPGDPFTIVVLPDPQNYAASYPATYNAQTQWCVDDPLGRNIVFVTNLGDATNDNSTTQWGVADTAMTILETGGVPFGIALGNHDGAPDTTTLYNQHFGVTRFAGQPYYGGHYGTDNDNHYELFSASGMDFIIFHLEVHEMGAGYEGMCSTADCTAAIAWMDGLLTNDYPSRRAIIVSHALMQPGGNPPAFMQHGQAIYDAVKDNPNVFLMMTGHLDQANHRADEYPPGSGHWIYTLISDYQMRPNGGNGWLRVMTFDPQTDTIHVETYSPTVEGGRFINKPTAHADNVPNDACARDCVTGGNGGNELLLPYDMAAGLPYQQIGQPQVVASGTTACVNWPNLAIGTEYEWYVTVSDGTTPVTGPVWNFTTALTCTTNEECNDGNPCTDDICNTSNLCENPPNNASCTDDGNPCTDDVCSDGACTHPADDTNACSDDNACTTPDHCAGGACVSTYAPVPGCCTDDADCNDGDPGTDDVCTAGNCSNPPVQTCTSDAQCDDGDVCTTDHCNLPNVAALAFDGSNDYVDFGAASGHTELGLTQFTIECWFKRTGTGVETPFSATLGNAVPIVTKGRGVGDGSNIDLNYFLGLRGAVVVGDFESFEAPGGNNDNGVLGSTTIVNGTWYHAALTFDGSALVLYLNGNVDGSLNTSNTPRNDSLHPFAIASGMDGQSNPAVPGGYFAGVVDEVRVWDHARSATEIAAGMNQAIPTAAGLVGRWGLDEGTGTVAGDSTPPQVNGTLTPAPPNGPTWANTDLPDFGQGTCQHTTAPDGTSCADDVYCDGAETCQAGLCVEAAPPCAADHCDEVNDDCWDCISSAECTDNNACTTDACTDHACVFTYAPTPGCCTADADCNDDNPGTTDTCDELTGNCSNTQNQACTTDAECNDNDPCSTDDCGGANAAALSFDGVDDHVTMGSTSALGLSTFTIECWFKRTGAGITTSTGSGGITAVPLVTKGRGEAETPANLNMNYFLGIAGNTLGADFEDTATGLNHPVTGVATIANNTWYHAAATYDGTTWRLYLGGDLDKTLVVGAYSPESTSIQHFGLGTALNSTGVANGRLAGLLDEVRIWNRALSQAEIQANMYEELTSGTGLVARWGLNEGSGVYAYDPVPPAQDGTLSSANGPTWMPGDLPPGLGQGICTHAPAPDNTPCPDDLFCDGAETCQGGLCVEAEPPCAADHCDEVNNDCWDCISSTECTDNNACTTDTCTDHACVFTYAPTPGCCVTNADCDDGDPDTGDVCTAGNCSNPQTCTTDAECDDLNACTTDDCVGANVAAIELNGTNQYIDLGNDNNTDQVNYLTNFGTSSFTIEGWFRADTATSYMGLFRQGSQNAYPQVVVQFPGSSPYNRIAGSIETSTTGTQVDATVSQQFTLGLWYHYAMVADRTPGAQTLTVYLHDANGNLVGSAPVDANLWGTYPVNDTYTGTPPNEIRDPVVLGVARTPSPGPNYNYYFDGRLDEVRIWDHVRTAQQIADNMHKQIVSATGLVHRWAMNENAGSTTADSGSTPTTAAVLVNNPLWVANDLVTLDGTCQYTPISGCCLTNEDCTAGGPCMAGTCNQGTHTCEYTYAPTPGCCTTAADCDDGDTCTSDTCDAANTCHNVDIPDCCASDADCDDLNVCTTDYCPSSGNAAALSFDGADDYVTMGQAPNLGVTTFTLECWFKWSGGGQTAGTGTGGVTAYPLIAKGVGEADNSQVDANYFLGIQQSNGVLAADFEEGAGQPSPGLNHPVTGTTPVTTGVWHHAAVTYNGTCWQLYLDGVPDTNGTNCPARVPRWDSLQHFGVGAAIQSNGTRVGAFSGLIDEVRVWNVARTQAEIQGNIYREIATATGLIGHWALDENANVTAYDSTSPAENGTLTNGPAWVSTGLVDFGTPNVCEHVWIGGCCNTAAECDDGDVCTTDECVDHACDYGPIPDCCHTAAECSDGDACTTDTCEGNECVNAPIPECCDSDADCNDGNACTADACDTANVAAIAFSGAAGNRVQFPIGTGVDYLNNFGTGSFTIEGWIYTDGGAADNTGIFRQGRQTTYPQVVVQLKGTGFRQVAASVETNQTSPTTQVDVTSSTILPVNEWHHFAMVVDRTPGNQWLRVHIDGGTPTSNGANLWGTNAISWTTDPSMLGCARDGSGNPILPFDGRLDEVRIWSNARTQAQIAADMYRQLLSAPGLVHRWGMNEASGTGTADSVGTASGTLMSGATWQLTGIPTFGDNMCDHTATNEGGTCDDGAWCTENDHCVADACTGTARNCADTLDCTTDTCNETLDQCDHTPVAGYCEIENACYADGAPEPGDPCHSCDADANPTGWSNAPNGTACDDGLFCTTGETCQSGTCGGGTARDCSDTNSCTADSCDDDADQCVHDPVPLNGTACDDGSACTDADVCTNGTCTGTAITCSDGNPCTSDTCNPSSGCVYTPIQGTLQVTLEIQGLTNTVTRPVTFVITGCGGDVTTLDPIPVTFTPYSGPQRGVGSVALTNVAPDADWIQVTEGHALSRLLPVENFVGECTATINFTSTDWLLAGDFSNPPWVSQNNHVDIQDFAILAIYWNEPVDPNLGSLADATGNGMQDAGDFGAIQANFAVSGDLADDCPPSAPPPGVIGKVAVVPQPALLRVPVAALGIPNADWADRNGDGVIDIEDIRLFAAENSIALTPEFEARLDRLERQLPRATGPGSGSALSD